MNNNIEYKEGRIFTIFNYITWFVLGNLCFLVSNILLILYTITFGIDLSSNISIILLISLIPMGPAITALCASMGKIIREKDINIVRYYIKAYKMNFKQSLVLWCMELVIIFISYIDLKIAFAGSNLNNFSFLFIIVCIFTIALGTIVFPIISRFELRIIDILKISFVYSIKKIHITAINIIMVFIGFCLIYVMPGTLFVCLISVLCFAIMSNNRNIINEIEEEIISN